MSAFDYADVRRTFEYLESLAELTDQVELDASRIDLMRTPTKAMAASMYLSAIHMWLAEHGSHYADDFNVTQIAEEYGE